MICEDASPWLWSAMPSRCVWNSKPSIANSPWPSRKQTVSERVRSTRWMPMAISASSVPWMSTRRPAASMMAAL